MGGLTSPFSPSYVGGRGGPRQRGYPEPFVLLEPLAQNPGCCVVFSCFKPFFRPWKLPGRPSRQPWTPGPPCPPQILDLLSAACLTYLVWTAFYEAEAACFHVVHIGLACAYPASPLKLVLLTVLDLCLCLCLTRVSCCGHPSIH